MMDEYETRHAVSQHNAPTQGSQVAAAAKRGPRNKRPPLANLISNSKVARTTASSHPTISLASATEEQLLPESEDYTMMSVDDPAPVLLSQRPRNVPDIDSDTTDPQLVAQYAQDIHRYMLEHEDNLKVVDYIANQRVISPRMRGVLMDWLVEVHTRFELIPETLYLTTLIIDKYLSLASCSKSRLQLVGVTAMLLASKYEEMWPPAVSDFEYMTDKAYSVQQIIQMEFSMLRTLDFNLGFPLPTQFLERYLTAEAATGTDVEDIARFVMENSITWYEMVQYKPSELAASAIVIAKEVLGNVEYTASLEYYSTYSREQLTPCIEEMKSCLKKNSEPTASFRAIRRKYRLEKFNETSRRADVAGYVAQL